MKNFRLILVVILLTSCSKEEKYDLYISTVNYNLNIENGEFRIDWYKNYKSNIGFSKNEKERLNELIYKYSIEKLEGENDVLGKENLIMPNFNDEITLKKGNKLKSKIYISMQVNLTETKLTKSEVEIYKFKEELFVLLRKNRDFKNNMDTLEIAKRSDKRLFL